MLLAKKTILLIVICLFLPGFGPLDMAIKNCQINDQIVDALSFEVKQGGSIEPLPNCYKANPNFIIKIALVDPAQFAHASSSLRKDELFVSRLSKVNPEILKYADDALRSNKLFMERATYLNRESLKYASSKLLDDKVFMTKMVVKDSNNYQFASERLRANQKIAQISFEDNGLLMEFAPDSISSSKQIAKIALKSNARAINFLSSNLQKDGDLKKISSSSSSVKSLSELEEYLEKNYILRDLDSNIAKITSHSKFFKDHILVKRNYITKWRKIFNRKSDKNQHILTSVDNKNHPMSWKDDFKEYPDLSKKIISFFKKRGVDNNTIESLRTTYLWKIKSELPTMAFNIYLLRNSNDAALGPEFSNVTSLTAIAQKQGDRWNLTVLEVIFGNEIKVGVNYENGHKKYILWDLYKIDEKDNNPKIIFKVEDGFKNYLEVYEETNGGKYQLILKKL